MIGRTNVSTKESMKVLKDTGGGGGEEKTYSIRIDPSGEAQFGHGILNNRFALREKGN